MKGCRDTVALVTGASRGTDVQLRSTGRGGRHCLRDRSKRRRRTDHRQRAGHDRRDREGSERSRRPGDRRRMRSHGRPRRESLFARIRADHGRLDLLVNNVWGGYENSECRPLPMVPFWEQSLDQWDRMFTAGVRAHLTASRLAVPLMLLITAGSSSAPRRISSRSGTCGTSFTTWRRTRFAAWRGRWLKSCGSTASRRWRWRPVSCAPSVLSRPSAARARSRPSMARADQGNARLPRPCHRRAGVRRESHGEIRSAPRGRRVGARIRVHRRRRIAAGTVPHFIVASASRLAEASADLTSPNSRLTRPRRDS